MRVPRFGAALFTLLAFSVFFALQQQPAALSSEPIPTQAVSETVQEALDGLVLYNYTNRQTLTQSRLQTLISEIALPVAYGEWSVGWSVDSDYLRIDDTVRPFSVRDLSGTLVTFDVVVVEIVDTPSVFAGNQPFTITASLTNGVQTAAKTFSGFVVPVMPPDFWGGVVYTVVRNAMLFVEGVFTTLWLSLAGTILGFLLAILIVSLRLMRPTRRDSQAVRFVKRALSALAKLYVTVFRGTPMIVQAAFFWYGLNLFGNPLICGLFVVSVNTAAYIAEILRGSIQAIDKGQMEASRSVGMTSLQAMRHVILPQAIKNAMPSIGNEFVINIKDTAVLSIIEIYELFYQTKRIVGNNYRQLEAYLVVAAIYLFLTYTVTKALSAVEKKLDMPVVELPSSN
jgi:His/Glu/Gln/Arg/opine family amino acid ABC transporter permease subunit